MRLIKSLLRRAKAKIMLEIELTRHGLSSKGFVYAAAAGVAAILVAVWVYDASAGMNMGGRVETMSARFW